MTDHQPLTSIFKRKTKSPHMNRWILEIREYNYDIQYKKGNDYFVADHPSRPVKIPNDAASRRFVPWPRQITIHALSVRENSLERIGFRFARWKNSQ